MSHRNHEDGLSNVGVYYLSERDYDAGAQCGRRSNGSSPRTSLYIYICAENPQEEGNKEVSREKEV